MAMRLVLPMLLAMSALVTPAFADQPGPVITHLAFRDHIVSIYSGSEISYTVRTSSGQVLSSQLGSDALLARYPGLYEHLNGAVGGSDSSGFAWAGMHRPGHVSVSPGPDSITDLE